MPFDFDELFLLFFFVAITLLLAFDAPYPSKQMQAGLLATGARFRRHQKQQSRRWSHPTALPSSPNPCRVLGRHRWDVETGK